MLLRTTRQLPVQFLIATRTAPTKSFQHFAIFAKSRNYSKMSTGIKQISTDKAMKLNAGGLIFVSGQIPAKADGTLVTGSIADQTTACIEGLKNILEAAGSSIAKVTKVTVFITSMDNFAEMNSVYEKYFGEHKPARSCVAVKELPKGVPVEVEAIALA
ncbi:hypothetical protein CKM354_000530400 [Cercospora kikuchii]|uniref:Uncharacterized protein n=1 Tax=Cercospora kikuchii TaxID=84275 RepID=A0A9P3CD25_9PEZI|nr:uncharacterized protein CKM354_000530400 [Cercospora kikuchii]GIZ42024.1 hypothetical protein CKM354_000530400 [Cercospora kikuchii]